MNDEMGFIENYNKSQVDRNKSEVDLNNLVRLEKLFDLKQNGAIFENEFLVEKEKTCGINIGQPT